MQLIASIDENDSLTSRMTAAFYGRLADGIDCEESIT